MLQEDWCSPAAPLTGWQPARPSHAPQTQLTKQECPPDKVLRTLKPCLLAETAGRKLYDCGENISGCVPSDCPHRERLGYTRDGQLTCEAAMLTLDVKGLYEKWYQDILDSQGQTPATSPTRPLSWAEEAAPAAGAARSTSSPWPSTGSTGTRACWKKGIPP